MRRSARDRADLALDAVAARRDHARDAHEVLVPGRPLAKKELVAQHLPELLLELGERALVAQGLVRERLHREELLRGGVRAAELARLERLERLERRPVAAAPALARALEAHARGGVDPDQQERAAGAQRLDLGRVPDRVDHVVAVAEQVALHALGQDGRSEARAERAAALDHVLARGLEPFAREVLADHVRERDGIEAAPLEQPHDLALARRVQPRDTDSHPLSSPEAGYHAFASLRLPVVKNARTLVTGAAGFVGSWLVPALRASGRADLRTS
jgi:hypothetical protein